MKKKKRQSVIALIKEDPTRWNGIIYKDIIYLRGYGPMPIGRKKKFIRQLPEKCRELFKLKKRANKASYKLDQEFKNIIS